MARYFAFLYVDDVVISKLLTSAIVILNPRTKWPAHVTVAGPFESLRNVPRKREYYRHALITGVGRFRSETQNTVYLRVGTHDLRKISSKPDYDYNPHITLYDGDNNDIGDELYFKLYPRFPFMKFHVSKLEIVKSGVTQSNMDTLLNYIDDSFFKRAGVNPVDTDQLGITDRVDLAIRAVDEAILESRKTA